MFFVWLYVVVDVRWVSIFGGVRYGSFRVRSLGGLKKTCLVCRYWCKLTKTGQTFFRDGSVMSKRELIDCICQINRGVKPEFLAGFSEEDLNAYLEHLMELDLQELAVTC
jgi:hypothetical protein